MILKSRVESLTVFLTGRVHTQVFVHLLLKTQSLLVFRTLSPTKRPRPLVS